MRSRIPKVLHQLAGCSLLGHVLKLHTSLVPEKTLVVYGHGGEQVRTAFAHEAFITWIHQSNQLGTGHAVKEALGKGEIAAPRFLVLYGDVPLLQTETLKRFLLNTPEDCLGLLTVTLDRPQGYGRILRDSHGNVARIVEEKDATAEERQVTEVNTGVMVLPTEQAKSWLDRLKTENAQGEYYLTDLVAIAAAEGVPVFPMAVENAWEVQGVNTKEQLADLERTYQEQYARRLMRAGVLIADPHRIDIRGEVEIAEDVRLEANVVLEGRVVIEEGASIGFGAIVKDAHIGRNVQVLPYSLIDGATIGDDCRIGPFARLRPETELAEQVHVGNFVEIKKTKIAQSSKANHLTYLGDSEVGQGVNIGAGTITCNYDGVNKHRTVIGDGAFIGSSSQLVAPVTIGADATIGAGSTITKDTPDGQLTLARARQISVPGWRRPSKES